MKPGDIARALDLVAVGALDLDVDAPLNLTEARPGAITWMKDLEAATARPLDAFAGALVIHPPAGTDAGRHLLERLCRAHALIATPSPRLTFARLLQRFFSHLELQIQAGIDATARIDPSARIGASVTIGAFCYVGPEASIGDGTVLHPSVTVHSATSIGCRCIINTGTVLGTRGFGFIRDAAGHLVHFPQIGRVIIEDDVEIQAGCTVARPGLGTTVVGRGTKIDCLCHIGHNARIGADCIVTACSEIGAGVQVKDRAWIGPNSCLIEGIVVGEEAFVGLGSVVIRDVAPNAVVAGSPAEPIERIKEQRRAVRGLLGK